MRSLGLTNKYLKDQHKIMVAFGYELHWKKGSRGGHPVYTCEGFEELELSSTPRDQKGARKRLERELRKRHPDHQYWVGRKNVSRKKTARRQSALVLVRPPLVEASPG
jgi:hypothetical protein